MLQTMHSKTNKLMVRTMKKIIQFIFLIMAIGNIVIFADQPITFKLKAAPNTYSVHVVSDFNHWSKTATPMHDFDSDGIWEAMLNLAPGNYHYRFLLDGAMWIKDPGNPNWDGEYSNSILWVKHPDEPELKNIQPELGAVIRSASLKIEADYFAGIGRHGLDVPATTILLNHAPQQFFFQQEINKIQAPLDGLADGDYFLEIHARDLAGNHNRPISSYFLVNSSNEAPIADAGCTIVARVDAVVKLSSGVSYDPDRDPLRRYDWRMISQPSGSKAKLEDSDAAYPAFTPDKIGRYVFSLRVNDGELWSESDSADVIAIDSRDYATEFRLADSSFTATHNESIRQAAVAGEFNRWSATANPMHAVDQDGIWTAQIQLDPGEYEYKFVVNGQHWVPDPDNPRNVADGWNGFNSVVSVTSFVPSVEVKTAFELAKVRFDVSKSISPIGSTLSFSWHQDIKNPQRFDLPAQGKIAIPTPQQEGKYFYHVVTRDDSGASSEKTIALTVKKGLVKAEDFSDSPAWARDAIIYEVYLRKFTPEGNIQGLIDKLPYLQHLGINGIWLMPIWEGPTAHGYGPSNFFEVEQDYGTLDDFKILLEHAHQAGIRVILDFIANHTSDQHPYFLSAYQNPNSPFRDWYRWVPDQQQVSYYLYEFHNDWDTLPNLNYENPNVRWYIIGAARHWVELGVDGFRCDVAWGVPHDFWKRFRRELKTIRPDFLLINEVLPRAPEYHDDEFDMSYDTDFYGNLLDVMHGRKPISAIEFGLRKTKNNYPAAALDFRYIENHDMDRFISQFGTRRTKLAATLLLTIPGTPLIYYGQEIGLREKTPPMEWQNQTDSLFTFYQRLIRLRRQHPALRHGEMLKLQTNADDRVYAYVRTDGKETLLIALNFSNQQERCQLFIPAEIWNRKSIRLEAANTSARKSIELTNERRFVLEIEPESSLIYRLKQ